MRGAETRTSGESNGGGSARTASLLAAILLLALAVRALDLFDPWSGKGFKTAFATSTTGAFAKNFVDHGFLESGLLTYTWRVELEDGAVVRQWYTHHPVLYAVLTAASMKALGGAEWTARLPWLLLSLLSVLSVYRFVALVGGRGLGLTAALLLAVVPFSAEYATMLWTDGATVLLFGLLGERFVRWIREGRAGFLRQSAALVFLGGLLDWSALLVLPGLLLHAFFYSSRRGGWKRLRPLLWLPAAAVAAVLVHQVHLRLVLPGEFVREDAIATLRWATTRLDPLPAFVAGQATYLVRGLTPVVAALVVVAAVAALWRGVRGRLRAEESLLLSFALPGLLYVFLFPARSGNHDFFLSISLPAFVGGAAAAWRGIERFVGTRLSIPRGVLLVALLAVAGVCVGRDVQRWRALRSDALARLTERDWLAPLLRDPRAVILSTSGGGAMLHYYSEAPIVEPVDDVRALERHRDRILSRLEPDRPVVFLFDLQWLLLPGVGPAWAELHAVLSSVAPVERREEHTASVPILAFDVFDLRGWATQAREETPR